SLTAGCVDGTDVGDRGGLSRVWAQDVVDGDRGHRDCPLVHPQVAERELAAAARQPRHPRVGHQRIEDDDRVCRAQDGRTEIPVDGLADALRAFTQLYREPEWQQV